MDTSNFDLLKSHIEAFTRKDGAVVAAHDDKRQAMQPKAPPQAAGVDAPRQPPMPGDVGHEEMQAYGKYFKKGDKVKDNRGKHHEVLSHNGPQVITTGGSYHPTKLHRA